MAVTIRLSRHGTKKSPYYRIVVTDERSCRDGKFIENIGTFNPVSEPVALELKKDRFDYWRSKGAQTSPTVQRIVKKHVAPAASA